MRSGYLEFASDNSSTGFRLHRLEVLNWGTFNGKIWSIEPKGRNSLLTGNIGSGKSTMVDALVTLLVPPQKIIYNKAAGADYRERTPYSYVRGEYKNQRGELGTAAQPVYLRPDNDFSVILAYFYNEGYGAKVTIAQVLWTKGSGVDKAFVVAQEELSIKEHFTGFGDDINKLKKRLRKLQNTQIFPSFSEYCQRFRNLFGIKADKALDLFNQTVAMKNIGDLNDFIRSHMLEQAKVTEWLERLRRHYDNLMSTYQAVQKARRQLQLLQPIIKESDDFEQVEKKIQKIDRLADAVPVFFAEMEIALLGKESQRFGKILGEIEGSINDANGSLSRARESLAEVDRAIESSSEGKQVKDYEHEIKTLTDKIDVKKDGWEKYTAILKVLKLSPPVDEEGFHDLLKRIAEIKEADSHTEGELKKKTEALLIKISGQNTLIDELTKEVESLRLRKTQIPEKNLVVRNMIAKGIGAAEEDIPFAGELLRVRKSESVWEGALERVLHNFGLSILVPEKLYRDVSDFVDSHDLRGRVVYYKAPAATRTLSKVLSEKSLIRKVEIKEDSSFRGWIYNELLDRFDLVCCDTMDEFRNEARALTKNGQIKGGRARHEKDDRYDISDRKRYVLGWSNAEKIKAIERDLETSLRGRGDFEKDKSDADKELQKIRDREIPLHDAMKFTSYTELSWRKEEEDLAFWVKEKKNLEKSSKALQRLTERRTSKDKEVKAIEGRLAQLQVEKGKIEGKIEESEQRKAALETCTVFLPSQEREELYPELSDIIGSREIPIGSISAAQSQTLKDISTMKKEEEGKSRDIVKALTRKMSNYITEFPAETSSVDADTRSIPEFRRFLRKIEEDDLPRFEERFKSALNEGVINDVAMFKAFLEQEELEIKQKIAAINESLKGIEYNAGTYIKLLCDNASDSVIKEFQFQLKHCLENILGDTDLYNEEKFLRVKAIIDRFNSREPADISWTNLVTDVRNWVSFSAIELTKDADEQKNYYSDSSGKSGGEKEKLAYTILASALAYQFGLEWSKVKSRSFRFVVIDEAFSRGSNDSTRYALELFKKLDLQLLNVTPLLKVNVIENYVDTVHFVYHEEGLSSIVRDISIKEYQEEKKERLRAAGAA